MRIATAFVALGSVLVLCATATRAHQPTSTIQIGLEKRMDPERAWVDWYNQAQRVLHELAAQVGGREPSMWWEEGVPVPVPFFLSYLGEDQALSAARLNETPSITNDALASATQRSWEAALRLLQNRPTSLDNYRGVSYWAALRSAALAYKTTSEALRLRQRQIRNFDYLAFFGAKSNFIASVADACRDGTVWRWQDPEVQIGTAFNQLHEAETKLAVAESKLDEATEVYRSMRDRAGPHLMEPIREPFEVAKDQITNLRHRFPGATN